MKSLALPWQYISVWFTNDFGLLLYTSDGYYWMQLKLFIIICTSQAITGKMHWDCFTLLLMRSNDLVITSPLYIYTLFFIATAPITIIAQDQSAWLWVLLIGPPWPNYFWLGPYPWLHWNRVPWSVWPLLEIRASTGPDPGSFYCGHLKSLCHSMHLHLFIASIVHELCYPQCVGAGFSSSYLPYSIWPSISSFCLPESSEGMTSLYSVPIIRSHKTCPPSWKLLPFNSVTTCPTYSPHL